jgi:hypothetical protein
LSQRCQWHRCACHSGINETSLYVTEVSMTLLCMPQLCQWHCYVCRSGVIDTMGSDIQIVFKT